MRQQVRPAACALAGLLVLFLSGPAIGSSSLVGEWTLVEQSYGKGESNLVANEANPVRLEFSRDGSSIRGLVRGGAPDAPALSWPRLVADASRAIHVDERRLSSTEDHVRVRYRVDPSPGDDLVLHVTEEYGVVEDGRALVGTVEVSFRRNGKDRGSYELHRRFERNP